MASLAALPSLGTEAASLHSHSPVAAPFGFDSFRYTPEAWGKERVGHFKWLLPLGAPTRR